MSSLVHVPQLGRIAFSQGVFAYPRQRGATQVRDLVVWCTACKATLEVESEQARDKTTVGFLWQRMHGRGDCVQRDWLIVEIPA